MKLMDTPRDTCSEVPDVAYEVFVPWHLHLSLMEGVVRHKDELNPALL